MKQIILFILVLLPVCVFAQFTETFDGPEINSANPWKGDLDKFIINADGWLQQNDPAKTAGKSSLSLNIPYSTNMQWEFDVKATFKPSDDNYIRLYLYEEDKDTYHYLQIGHDGAKKLSLRMIGNQELIRCKSSLFAEDQDSFRLKITLEDNKDWSVYSRKAVDTYYVLEGTCVSPITKTVSDGQFFITTKYTQNRYQNFSLDNIRISHVITATPLKPEGEDPEPPVEAVLPTLVGMQPLSLSELQFVFDLPVEIAKAKFSISGIGKANRVAYADQTKTTVNTRYPREMVPGGNYTISYEGITDQGGNELTSYSEEVVLETEEDAAKPGSVVINEIMADPKGIKGLPETEYVELYNTTENGLSLTDWQFAYGGKSKPMTSFELSPKGYAVLYRSGREVNIAPGAVKVPLDNFPSQLANAGKQLQLLDASGNLIDEVTYEKAKPGKSWERSSGGWHLSSDPRGGTPGSVNSSGEEVEEPEKPGPVDPEKPDTPDEPSILPTVKVEPKEFIINELLPNPYTGGSEYVELYNRSGHSLPLSGLSVAVRKTDGALSTHYPLSAISTIIEPDGYAVLTKSVAGVTDFYMVSAPASLFEISKLPILANTSSTLVLFRTDDETIIDEVAYSSKWHASSIKDQKGVALERIDPDAETQSSSNWTSASSSAGYGTPGHRNSQSDVSLPDEPDKPTGIEVPEWVPGLEHYKLTYYLDQPGYSCRAFVFNAVGQRVAEIANHELLGLSGELPWDGSSLAGSRLRTGVYIFYAELYHASGTVKRYKQVFLVR